jgi:mannose-1-phosphate guanylyltransferase
MLEHYYAVIMAGGGGTRLWPLSRKARPKQMLQLAEEGTLFQNAVNRLDGVFPPEHIFVVTIEEQAVELQKQCPGIPPENFLLEPMPRGTASVVGMAAIALHHTDPQAVMAVLTADHFIGNVALFRQLLQSGYDLAQEGHLVTLGVTPTFPATGYGYIQYGKRLGTYGDVDAFKAIRFAEKPNEETARKMLASGDHAWNSGMFVWTVADILREFERQMPPLHAQLQHIAAAWGTPEQGKVLAETWPQIKAETIDYGIMEGAQNVAVIPARGLGWNDVGSWDSLFDVNQPNPDGNIVIGGQHIGLDTHGSLIYVTQERRLIVTIGVDDLVVVDTGDVLLVCRKDQAQKVRQVVDHLKKNGQDYV